MKKLEQPMWWLSKRLLLLLLLSSSSSSFAFPATWLGFTILVRVLRIWPFFVCLFVCFFSLNPTIEVVTFPLPGWYMLDVFLLPALIRLGRKRHDFWSPCDGMHVCTD